MAQHRFLRFRRLQRLGKLLIIALSAYSISYFVFTFSKLSINTNIDNEGSSDIDVSHVVGNRGLNVHVWRLLCGETVAHVRSSLFFPRYPDEKKIISEFQIQDDGVDYGQRIFGFVHPPHSGLFRFAIASDDSSELWLSTSDDPDKKQLIARVFDKNIAAWTGKKELQKYPEQISNKTLKLESGKKYFVEALHKQGTGDGLVQVFWKSDSDFDFKLISSEFLSPYTSDTPVIAKKDAIHIVLSKQYRHELEIKANRTTREFLKFYSLPFISQEDYLPSCTYRSTFVSKDKVRRYGGIKTVYESNIYPPDETAMGTDAGIVWSRANRVADREVIESVVDKIIASLQISTTEKYFLKRIHRVTQKPDPVYGDRYLVDLKLGLKNTKRSFRLTEHVYQKKGSCVLCSPEGIKWNKTATVYFILPVKDQGAWVYHFINHLTVASLLTGDENFHVIVSDFDSQDINLTKAFDTPLLRSRHTVINMTGKFYKTLALNTAVEHVPSELDLLFLFDLHIDVPVDILDSVRKNTIKGRIAYFPAVGRLDCASTHVDHQGFWQMNGYGLLSVYKSDWIRFGGMNTEEFKHKWGGEDWDLLDRVVNAQLEIERIKYPGLYHHYHTRQMNWQ